MRLAVFGASGGVGRELLRLAGERGHRVIAVYRAAPKDRAPAPAREILVNAHPTAEGAIREAVLGADAVVSTIGIKRTNPNNPWAPLASPPDLTTRFAKRLTCVLREEGGPRRVVAVSAAGVGDSRDSVNAPFRWLMAHSNVGAGYRDLDGMEAVFAHSDLDWTCVRPTILTNGPRTERVRQTTFFGLTSHISRADVAWYLLQCLEPASDRARRTPMITAGA